MDVFYNRQYVYNIQSVFSDYLCIHFIDLFLHCLGHSNFLITCPEISSETADPVGFRLRHTPHTQWTARRPAYTQRRLQRPWWHHRTPTEGIDDSASPSHLQAHRHNQQIKKKLDLLIVKLNKRAIFSCWWKIDLFIWCNF